MGKKIDQLRAAVEELKREMADVGARLDQAQGDLIVAEREARRTQKPTGAMLRVLEQLAKGATIRQTWYHPRH